MDVIVARSLRLQCIECGHHVVVPGIEAPLAQVNDTVSSSLLCDCESSSTWTVVEAHAGGIFSLKPQAPDYLGPEKSTGAGSAFAADDETVGPLARPDDRDDLD